MTASAKCVMCRPYAGRAISAGPSSPVAGAAVGESVRDAGGHALVVVDELRGLCEVWDAAGVAVRSIGGPATGAAYMAYSSARRGKLFGRLGSHKLHHTWAIWELAPLNGSAPTPPVPMLASFDWFMPDRNV